MLDDKDILNIQQKVFELKGQNKEEMELPNIKDINENTWQGHTRSILSITFNR